MADIFFTSDTHYNHKNIVRGTTSWSSFEKGSSHQNTRNFDTLEEHNNKLVENINKTVKENDILYHLGDFSFQGINSIWEFRKRINCRTIHLIYGNHDHHIENNRILPNVHREEPYSAKFVDGPGIHMRDKEYPDYVECQDLFTSCNYYKELKLNHKHFILCHFAFRVWNKSHHGSINLYGHSHGTLDDYEIGPTHTDIGDGVMFKKLNRPKAKCMDVGIDTHPEFRPYHLNEILEIMSSRELLLVDHHNRETN